MTIKWMTRDIVFAAHARSLKDHSGGAGLRDEGKLQSALERPKSLHADREPSLFELAACLLYGLAKNHAFVDGNKRTAFLAAYIFLGVNGQELDSDEAEAAAIVMDIAAGNVTESDLARWLKAKSTSL